MLEKTKMKLAARRVKTTKKTRRTTRRVVRNRRPSFWARVWYVVTWPFRKIWQFICWVCKKIWQFIVWVFTKIVQFICWLWRQICRFFRWLWNLICGINLVGLLNLLLLVAIIVLCSMLIIDIVNCRKKPVVIVADPVTASMVSKSTNTVAEPTTKPVSTSVRYVRPHTNTLPIARDGKSGKMLAEPIRVTNAKPNAVTEKQTAKCGETLNGDIIIENRGDAKLLNNGTQINGNLYLQNMRKYVLPCDIKITGNMFIRDVTMLQFCGDFEITGNIYVTPRSSFGPIPRSAHLGGQIIL